MANKIYNILKNWDKDDKIKFLYAIGLIRPKVFDWLVYYNRYLELRKKQNKTTAIQWTADEYKIGFRTMWDVVNYFEKPIKEFIS